MLILYHFCKKMSIENTYFRKFVLMILFYSSKMVFISPAPRPLLSNSISKGGTWHKSRSRLNFILDIVFLRRMSYRDVRSSIITLLL